MIFKIKGKVGGIYIADQKVYVAATPRGVGGWAGWGEGVDVRYLNIFFRPTTIRRV